MERVVRSTALIRAVLTLGIWCAAAPAAPAGAQSAVFELPVPRGPYSIGTVGLYLVDRDRAEVLPGSGIKPRELLVRVWYPSAGSAGKTRGPYLERGSATAIEKRFNLRSGFESQIQTHSLEGTSFAHTGSPFPVVLLEHGLGMVPTVYTALAEDLASFGFVVAATNHTDTSLLAVFPDGRSIAYRAPWPTNVERKVQGAAMGSYLDVWVSDVRFVLDELGRRNQGEKFWRGHLDLSKTGILGHSYGGTTSAVATRTDERIAAGANLDGSIYPGMEAPVSVGKPFLTMSTEGSSNIHAEFSGAPGDSYSVTVKSGDHMSFTDVNLLRTAFGSPADSLQRRRTLDLLERTRDLVVQFFSKYLKGGSAPSLDTELVILRK
jgi:predicted dienelactone hydrolase